MYRRDWRYYSLLLVVGVFFAFTVRLIAHDTSERTGTHPLYAPEREGREVLRLTPQVTRGQLDNGFRYYLQRNATPENIVELRLVVRAGSVHEAENELGVAHFVEHMAFNGTDQFPGNEIIAYLETLGSDFGADSNAHTGFDQTVFVLQIPTEDPHTLEKALDILAQWAFHIRFADEEIEKERGVILEEWRRGQTAEQRVRYTHLRALLYPTRYAARLPIGNEESIRTVSPETIRNFYSRWYRPSRMALVAVGDVDATHMQQLLTARFGVAPPSEGRAAPPKSAYSGPNLRASVVYEKGTQSHQLSLYQKEPAFDQDTVAAYRHSLVQLLFGAVFNNRLQEFVARPESPLLRASLSLTAQRVTANERVRVLQASFEAAGEKEAVEAVATELSRLAHYGVRAEEFNQGLARLARLYQSYWDARSTRSSDFYAAAYVDHFIYGDLLLHPDKELELGTRLLPTIDASELAAQALQLLYGPHRLIALSGVRQTGAPEFTPREIIDYFRGAARRGLSYQPSSAFVSNATREQPLVDEEQFSQETESFIVTEDYDQELEVFRWRLSNGVQVVFKETAFESDQVLFDMYSKGGYVNVPEGDYPAARVAVDVVEESGLSEWSPNDLRTILADTNLSIKPYLRQFSEGLGGSTSPTDIDTFLQLVYLYFTAPRYDQQRAEAYLRTVRSAIEFRHNSPRAFLADRLIALLYNDHPLVRTLTVEEIDAIDPARSFDIYRERFQNGADFTAVLVGNISPDTLRPYLRYLAQIPSQGEPEDWARVQFVRESGAVEEHHQHGEDRVALFRSLFWGDFEWSLSNNFLLRALSQALTNRLQERLREELSTVYSVGSFANAPRLPKDYYTIFLDLTTDPGALTEVQQELNRVLDSMHTEPLSDQELLRIQETERSNFAADMQENSYWIELLRYSDLYQYNPADALERPARIDALTAEGLLEAARRYTRAERYIEISVVPTEDALPNNPDTDQPF